MSHALKTLLPLKRLLIEVVSALSIDDDIGTSIHATVFEDNQSALYLAVGENALLQLVNVTDAYVRGIRSGSEREFGA